MCSGPDQIRFVPSNSPTVQSTRYLETEDTRCSDLK
jgi:hypothetical protein